MDAVNKDWRGFWSLMASVLRMTALFLTRSIYRLDIRGGRNVPKEGGALLVSNHVSLVDSFLISAAVNRPVRFLMLKDIYDHPAIRPLAKIFRAIPVSSEMKAKEMVRSLRTASDAIRAGEVVCIFAEGHMTRTGELLPFHRGFERMMHGLDAPIIPLRLDGVWGSLFSNERGRYVWKVPRRFPYPVTVTVGQPMLPSSTACEVRDAVEQLIPL